jgi:hypothetical protein
MHPSAIHVREAAAQTAAALAATDPSVPHRELPVADLEHVRKGATLIQMLQEDIDGATISTTNDPVARAIKRTIETYLQDGARCHVCVGTGLSGAIIQTWRRRERGRGKELVCSFSGNASAFLINFDNKFAVRPILFSISISADRLAYLHSKPWWERLAGFFRRF